MLSALPSCGVQLHFHVLAAGSAAAQGNISTQWITAQVTTLNKAYSFAGVTFVLASVDRTVNSAWYNMQQGSSTEARTQPGSPQHLSATVSGRPRRAACRIAHHCSLPSGIDFP